ncbi:MAG: hypothetical protein O3C67_04600 [Cyanobacteria bacterium]|nr:hypothetical protein [Cyanobacteriota bacterium]
MKLPYAAAVDRRQILQKLETYALDFNHPSGKHKARLFRSKLGITLESKTFLADALMEAVLQVDAIATTEDQYGKRYVVDFPIAAVGGGSMVRSAWIIRQGEPMPRLTSVYPI